MGTLAEEIFSRKAGRKVSAGEIVVADVDVVMSHDTTTPLAICAFRELGRERVFDASRVVIPFDHIVPAATVSAAELQRQVRTFVAEQGIQNLFEEGVCHQVMAERGFVLPGTVVIGADSHTCTGGAFGAFATGMGSTDIAVAYATGKNWFRVPETYDIAVSGRLRNGVCAKDLSLAIIGALGVDGATYKALEYTGEAIRALGIGERMTICNMAVEMGAKAGLIAPDAKTIEYVSQRSRRPFVPVLPQEPDYEKTFRFDASTIEPMVACPHDVDRVRPASELAGTPIDQVFIGTCTNGRLEDLAEAARILAGRKVHPSTRLVVVPASRSILLEAIEQGIIGTLVRAGAAIGPPGCGPCIGRHLGALAAGERALTTMNRNFRGRMGSPDAEIYISGPAVAAATAVLGRIGLPGEVEG